MLRKLRNDKAGFTLIELMIVIAIIGILAAIAIPNFIAYRNRAYCSSVEADVASVAAAIGDYFAVPAHTALPAFADLSGVTLGDNTANLTIGGAVNGTITISGDDNSSRCPNGGTFTLTLGGNDGAWS